MSSPGEGAPEAPATPPAAPPPLNLRAARTHLLNGEDAEARAAIMALLVDRPPDAAAKALLETLDKRAAAAWRRAMRAGDEDAMAREGAVLLELDLMEDAWLEPFIGVVKKRPEGVRHLDALLARLEGVEFGESAASDLFDMVESAKGAPAALEFGFAAMKRLGYSPSFLRKLNDVYDGIAQDR